jgi:hypothetical protein
MNHFLHWTGVPLRSTPASKKGVGVITRKPACKGEILRMPVVFRWADENQFRKAVVF